MDRMAGIGFSQSGNEESAQNEQMKEKVMASLKEHFRPEFLNRLDDIVMFDVLAKETLARIVDTQVEEVVKRLATKRISLTLSPEVKTWLSGVGYNPQYGARPLKRAIQDKILTPIATLMVGQGVMEGGSIAVSMKAGEPHFEVKKTVSRVKRAKAEIA
jgi:ATP-dependent Clp protease ATP-binding subunit ClpB